MAVGPGNGGSSSSGMADSCRRNACSRRGGRLRCLGARGLTRADAGASALPTDAARVRLLAAATGQSLLAHRLADRRCAQG